MDDPRPERTVGIEGLALEPLAVLALQVARGHVEADRVAEDIIVDLFFGDVSPLPAHDHRQLDLVIELLRRLVVHDFSEMADYRGGRLGEKNRRLRVLELYGAGPGPFLDVLLVIHAEKNDVLSRPGDRREDLNLVEIPQGAGAAKLFEPFAILLADIAGRLFCRAERLASSLDEGLHAFEIS